MIKNRFGRKRFVIGLVIAITLGTCVGCGKKATTNVEAEVAEALAQTGDESSAIEPNDDNKGDDAVNNKAAGVNQTENKDKSDDTKTSDLSKNNYTKDNKKSDSVKEIPKYSTNPFIGSNSTATSYDIKFTITTDSGIAGFTWGSDGGTDGEYYLWAFDCTRDIPRLYTSRRMGEDVWDENYTNLDMMYPEMSMFTSSEHYIEIAVNGTLVKTLLDSVEVATTTIAEAKPIGQIGVWVMDGDYHATYDDIFIAEKADGTGEYLYSEDFSGKKSIFYPFIETKKGKLYAEAGYNVVLPTKPQ